MSLAIMATDISGQGKLSPQKKPLNSQGALFYVAFNDLTI
jgi:hypothetical protein